MAPVAQYDAVLHGQRVTVKVYRSPTYEPSPYRNSVRRGADSYLRVDDTAYDEPARPKASQCGRPSNYTKGR